MARKRTKLSMSREELAQIKQAIRSAADLRDKERLQVVLWSMKCRLQVTSCV